MAGAKLSRHRLEENAEAVDDAEDGEHRDKGGGDYDPGCTALLVVIHSVDSATLARVLGTGLAYVLNLGSGLPEPRWPPPSRTSCRSCLRRLEFPPWGRLSWCDPLGGLV